MDEKGNLSPLMRLACGLGAGLSEAIFAVTPMVSFELIRISSSPVVKQFKRKCSTCIHPHFRKLSKSSLFTTGRWRSLNTKDSCMACGRS